jgi:O-antigen ligase
MTVLFALFFLSLLLGQLAGFTITPGVTVYAHDVSLVIMIIAACIQSIKKKNYIPVLVKPIVVFSFVAFVSLLFAVPRFGWPAIGISSLYLFRFMAYAALYAIITQEYISGKIVLRWLYYFGTGISILGLIQFVLYPQLQNLSYLGWDPHYYRLFSTLFDPNFTGIIIVLTILLGIHLIQKNRNRWLYVSEAINAGALFLTYSRSSWAACVVSILIWVLWTKRWKLGVCIGACVVIFLLLPTPGGKTLRLFRTDSTFSRISNWKETVQLIQKSPIIGYGFNTLRFVHNDQSIYLPDTPVSRAASGVDNSFLFLLVTTGIAGFVAYLWIILQTIKRDRSLLYVCVLAALGFHGLFINSLFYPWVMIWFWIFVGVAERTTSDI